VGGRGFSLGNINLAQSPGLQPRVVRILGTKELFRSLFSRAIRTGGEPDRRRTADFVVLAGASRRTFVREGSQGSFVDAPKKRLARSTRLGDRSWCASFRPLLFGNQTAEREELTSKNPS
jgi:hypothetical protein